MPRAKKLGMSKTDPRLIRGRETEAEAMKLRLNNKSMSLKAIGAILGITAQGVSDAIQRALSRQHDAELVKEVRQQHIDIYNMMIAKDLHAAFDGDKDARERVLRVMLRKEKVAGCHQETPQGATGPAVAFNYYMPVAQKDELQHVEPDDFNLPRLTAGNVSANGSANGHNGNGAHE